MVGRSMRVLFVTHYFHPEVGAPQTRILEAAALLRERGHQVTVLTGFPNYPDGIIPAPYRRRLFMRERLDDIGIDVVRSAVYPAPNRGFARRLVNHASFALSSMLAAPFAGRVDAVIAETPPLFTAVAAVPIAAMHRAPLVLNVADLWPESAVQLGLLSNRAAIKGAELLERFAYARAKAITVPTPGMRSILLERGQPDGKVVLLRNAVDVDRFAIAPGGAVQEPRRVLYCGTVGLAQGVGTLVEAARRLEQEGDQVEVVIAGDGAERAQLEQRASELGLERVRFAGRVARDRIPDLIASADITVMSLRDVPLFQDAVPTKLLEYMAAAKPVVAAAGGQVAEVMRQSGAGIACPPEDPAAMAAAIRTLASDSDRAQAMGLEGRRYVEEHLSRRSFVAQLEQILESLVSVDGDAARVRR
jgi:glycosyltransferase involved in cell wall biosynthesis